MNQTLTLSSVYILLPFIYFFRLYTSSVYILLPFIYFFRHFRIEIKIKAMIDKILSRSLKKYSMICNLSWKKTQENLNNHALKTVNSSTLNWTTDPPTAMYIGMLSFSFFEKRSFRYLKSSFFENGIFKNKFFFNGRYYETRC